MKVLTLCQGKNVPSTRFRIDNLIESLETYNVDITVKNAFDSAYPPNANLIKRISWLSKELFYRIPQVCSAYRYDAVIIQRELISTLPTFEKLIKTPKILDVDDAVWLYRSGFSANNIAKSVDHIVCGNNFLADYFRKFGKPVSIIPTAVDIEKFFVNKNTKDIKVIGWSGTSGGFKFLYSIEEALFKILTDNPEWTLSIISDKIPTFKLILNKQFIYTKWSPDNEVNSIQNMDIGIMPIEDDDWSRGKCSYKMLLYMACGLPVVVSDYGMNSEILALDFIGYGVTDKDSWCEALQILIDDISLRERAGISARAVVTKYYSIEVATKKWNCVFENLITVN